MKAIYTLLLAATLAACASIQPAPVQAGDRCLRCRRAVADLRLAGEIIDNMRAPFPFRTPGCMAKYVKANGGQGFVAVFVTDYRTGRMVPASAAWFVPTELETQDGKRTEADYLAFASRRDAEASRKQNEPLLRWAQVVGEASAN